jgi:ADP-dependent NAD(P)H-hydrate dehydratase / NAD(P)H-hydrate epimerase
VLLKGARTIIADLRGHLRVITASTPVLAGLIGGLLASHHLSQSGDLADLVATAAWWHSQAAIRAAEEGGEWSVDPLSLIKSIGSGF